MTYVLYTGNYKGDGKWIWIYLSDEGKSELD